MNTDIQPQSTTLPSPVAAGRLPVLRRAAVPLIDETDKESRKLRSDANQIYSSPLLALDQGLSSNGSDLSFEAISEQDDDQELFIDYSYITRASQAARSASFPQISESDKSAYKRYETATHLIDIDYDED